MDVQTKFVSVAHPQANGKEEETNKMILKGVKKKLDNTKELWAELLNEILWSYHITPHSTTKETPFTVEYRADGMHPVEIDTPLWRCSQFN